MSTYNFEQADTASLFHQFDHYEAECRRLIDHNLHLPAYEMVMKASHVFNLLDARNAISVTQRQRHILRVRALARLCAQAYHETRRALGFPLAPRSEEHTSELQSRGHLVCRLLLEQKKNTLNTGLLEQ